MSFSIKTLSGELISVQWPSTRDAVAEVLRITPYELKLFKGDRMVRYVEYEVEKDDVVCALIEQPEYSIEFTNLVQLENGLERYDVVIYRQQEIKCTLPIVIMWDSTALLGGDQPFIYDCWDPSSHMVKDYPAFSYVTIFTEYTFYCSLLKILSTSNEIYFMNLEREDMDWLETRIDKFIQEGLTRRHGEQRAREIIEKRREIDF